jgi:Fe-S cluster assembly ATP-binding protein
MLIISNLTVKTKADKTILQDINLEFKLGKIYAISGQNGSGKSTLAQVIISNPEYILSQNSQLIFNQVKATTVSSQEINKSVTEKPTFPSSKPVLPINLKTLSPDQRSQLGIFVSQQYPTEIPGVNFLNYLKLIIEINRQARGLSKLNSKQTLDLIHSKLELIGWRKDILKRNLNEGMSGGERKKSEILQMLLLDPKLIILDEIDSGLDKDALEIIVEIIKNFMNSDKTLIIITHQQKILDLLQPDEIITLKGGRLVF